MQQSQSLSSSSSSISEDIIQHSAPKAHGSTLKLTKESSNLIIVFFAVVMHNIQRQMVAPGPSFPQSNQSGLYQGVQPSREAMQENLMPLLNSFNWESAFANEKPQQHTNARGLFEAKKLPLYIDLNYSDAVYVPKN